MKLIKKKNKRDSTERKKMEDGIFLKKRELICIVIKPDPTCQP